MTLSVVLVLSACGDDETLGPVAKNEDDTDKTNTEIVDKDNDEDAEIDSSLLVASEKVYLWKDESTDIEWMSYYAMIMNDGDVTIDVRNASVTYYDDEDDSVIAVSTQGIDIHPYILDPGEVAYVNVYEPAKDIDLNTKVSTELGIDPIPSDEKIHWLNVESVNGKITGTGLKITGKMTNDGPKKTSEINVVSGVYDENDELLGILTGGSEVRLDPNKSSGFELFNPPFPNDIAELATQYEAAAYWVSTEE